MSWRPWLPTAHRLGRAPGGPGTPGQDPARGAHQATPAGTRAAGSEPRIVVLLDGYAAFRADFDTDAASMAVMDAVQRLISDGPEVGINLIVSGDQAGAVPKAVASVVRQKLLLRLADSSDYSMFGVRSKDVPSLPPGRGVIPETTQVVHIARPADGLRAAVAEVAGQAEAPVNPPAPVEVLASEVPVEPLLESASLDPGRWFLPLGQGERELRPIGLTLYPGEHAVIAGVARSGRTTALWVCAEVVKRTDPEVTVIGLFTARSRLVECQHVDTHGHPRDAASLLEDVAESDRPHLVLVDDADAVDDAGGVLQKRVGAGNSALHVVVAARADALRTLYTHWTKAVRQSKAGLLLVSESDMDGDLLGVRLPRQPPVAITVGRGYTVAGGDAELIQLAVPTASPSMSTPRPRTTRAGASGRWRPASTSGDGGAGPDRGLAAPAHRRRDRAVLTADDLRERRASARSLQPGPDLSRAGVSPFSTPPRRRERLAHRGLPTVRRGRGVPLSPWTWGTGARAPPDGSGRRRCRHRHRWPSGG